VSSQRYVIPLRFNPGFSLRLAVLLTLTHVGGIGLLIILPWQWWQIILMSSVLAIGLIYNIGRHVLLIHQRSITEVNWTSDGRWLLTTRSGDSFPARLSENSFLHPQLVVLNFNRGRWKRQSVILFRDALDQESFRRLRVRLGREVCVD